MYSLSAAKSIVVKTPVKAQGYKPQGYNTQGYHEASMEAKPAEKALLHSALTHLQGQINFEKVATDIEVSNAEAA
jgi:hypothetical protein